MTESGSALDKASLWLRQRWLVLEPWLRRHGVWLAVSAVVALGVGVSVFFATRSHPPVPTVATSPPDNGAPGAHGAPGTPEQVPGAPTDAPASSGAATPWSADAGPGLSPTVNVVFSTYPGRRATVMWGGKRLGIIDRGKPLVVERPRDSGPMDVVIRSPGYLAVHARAYTFDDETVEVRITPVDKKDSIYGYREPIPPDAGVPLP